MKKQEKTKIIDKLTKELSTARGIVLANFEGLNSSEQADLRKLMRTNKIKFRVVKNTLIKRSFKPESIQGIEPMLKGPVALAISQDDPIAPAKVLKEFLAGHEKIKIRGAFIENKVLSTAETITIAGLPSREVLLSQFIGKLKFPSFVLVCTLSGVLRQFAGVLQAVKEKKEKEPKTN
jgi:large subunit ribosomal protein L10